MSKENKKFDKTLILNILKGSLIAIVVSLISILFFAFIVKLFGLSDNLLKIVNQIIKAISILFGTYVGLKHNKNKGLIKGLCIGLCYTLFAFLIFSILNGNVNFDKSLLNDVIFGGIMGAICGIICVNIKNKSTKNC